MKLIFSDESWDDYQFWQQNNKKLVTRINQLIKDIKRNPFEGIGKPEPLKYELQGCWSRRIDNEHRLVYEFSDNELRIVSCRFHY